MYVLQRRVECPETLGIPVGVNKPLVVVTKPWKVLLSSPPTFCRSILSTYKSVEFFTTNAQNIFYKLKVYEFVDLAACQICPGTLGYAQQVRSSPKHVVTHEYVGQVVETTALLTPRRAPLAINRWNKFQSHKLHKVELEVDLCLTTASWR